MKGQCSIKISIEENWEIWVSIRRINFYEFDDEAFIVLTLMLVEFLLSKEFDY